MFDKKAQIGNLIRWAEPEQAEMRSVSYTQSFEVQRNPLCLPALTRGPTSERKAANCSGVGALPGVSSATGNMSRYTL